MAKTKVLGDQEASSDQVTETVTYTPGHMDPSVIKWAGQTFQANVPKELSGNPDGTATEKLNFHIIQSARANPHFKVGSGRSAHKPAALPVDAEGYRAYLIEWLKDPALDSPQKLIERFVRDRELQLACEVGSDDYAYLATLFMPRLHELAKAHEFTEGQVAQMWVNHGVNQLPW